jgi:hypothetical protein
MTTDDGKALAQAHVDKLAGFFVSDISEFRQVDPAFILASWGKGDILIGEDSKTVGMVDEVSNFQGALNFIKSKLTNVAQPQAGGKKMAKIKAQLDKMSAKLVIVDDEESDVEGVDVTEITVAWLEENLPELVEEVRGEEADDGEGDEPAAVEPDTDDAQALAKAKNILADAAKMVAASSVGTQDPKSSAVSEGIKRAMSNRRRVA